MYNPLYTVAVYNPEGVYQGLLSGIRSIDVIRAVNEVGVLTVQTSDRRFLFKNYRLGVFRTLETSAPALMLETQFMIKGITRRYSGGEWVYTLLATSGLGLLERRHVMAHAATPGASKSMAADSMCHEIVAECLANTALTSTNRATLAGYLGLAGPSGLAPIITKAFAWQRVLTVCKDVAGASAQQGVPLFYDVVSAPQANNTYKFEFRTYINQRGTDRRQGVSTAPAVFSIEQGNLSDITIAENWREEITSGIGAGQGYSFL